MTKVQVYVHDEADSKNFCIVTIDSHMGRERERGVSRKFNFSLKRGNAGDVIDLDFYRV